MLVDDFGNGLSGFVYPSGERHDEAVRDIRARVRRATPFVLDGDAVAMACHVALSRPSSILSALPWVRLPYPATFIEWSTQDARRAMAELGSPLKERPRTISEVERVGFLLSQSGDPDPTIRIEYVHRDRSEEHNLTVCDAAPVLFSFVPPVDLPDAADAETVEAMREKWPTDAKGPMREWFRLVRDDPHELAASMAINDCLSWKPHPDFARLAVALAQTMGRAETETIEADQAREAEFHILTVLIPALILLNARNAVSVETVEAPEKLNRKRAAMGKPPLLGHRLVRIRLEGARYRAAQADGAAGGPSARGTMVRGHFKVRRSGIFWWSPHPRRGFGAVTHGYEVRGPARG